MIEKREERQAQVIPPSSPSSPVEPVAVPAKQVTPVIENKPTKAVEKKEEPAGRKRPSFPSRPPEPVVVPQKQDVPVEKHVSARQPSIPTPEMVRIPPGSFTMGKAVSVGQTPIHQIRFAEPFAMARYETIYDEYDRFAQATGGQLLDDQGWGRGRRPVIGVSWQNANAYAQWLSQQTGQRYRLPTEAEWEYAARSGGMDETWAGTSDESRLKEYAVYRNKGGTEPVGSKRPNGLGLYDMSGNVWEWVQDCWHKTYTGAPSDGSAWREADEGDCDLRVIRGGSWNDSPQLLRATLRYMNYTDNRYDYVGFRLVQDLP